MLSASIFTMAWIDLPPELITNLHGRFMALMSPYCLSIGISSDSSKQYLNLVTFSSFSPSPFKGLNLTNAPASGSVLPIAIPMEPNVSSFWMMSPAVRLYCVLTGLNLPFSSLINSSPSPTKSSGSNNALKYSFMSPRASYLRPASGIFSDDTKVGSMITSSRSKLCMSKSLLVSGM